MHIKQLSDLVEVAKYNSMNAAAKNIHMSRQALSSSLENLEQELGCQLLDRTKSGIRLTQNGRKTLAAAQDILGRLDVLYDELSDNTKSPVKLDNVRGKLNIQIAPMLSISVLPLAFAEFHSSYPNVSISTCENYRQAIIEQVSNNADVCGILLVSPLIEEFFSNIPENVKIIELKTYPIYIGMSARHTLATQKSLSLGTIAKYPIIVFEVGGINGVHALEKLIDIDVILATNNKALCENTLKAGQAIMYSFPPYVKYNIFPDFRHIALNDKRTTFTALVAVNKNMPANMQKTVSLFIEAFRQYL